MANGGQKLTKTPLQKPGGDPPAPLPPFCFWGELGGGCCRGQTEPCTAVAAAPSEDVGVAATFISSF